MRRVPHSWREAYEAALIESDPTKLIGRIEYALNVLERRYSDWNVYPGTPAELAAIQNCISALLRLIGKEQVGRSSFDYESSGASNGIRSTSLSHDHDSNPNHL